MIWVSTMLRYTLSLSYRHPKQVNNKSLYKMYSDYKSKNNRNLGIDMTFANVRGKNDKIL